MWQLGEHETCTRGHPPSKLRSAVAHAVKKTVPWRWDLYKRSRETFPSGESLYLMKTKMQNIKKVCFCTKLFKNTIFTMYEWWRFQRYSICLKKLEIRISIEKLNFILLHVEGSIQTKLKLDKKPKTREQIQNSETKNRGAGVEHRGVCVWNVRNKPKIEGRTTVVARKENLDRVCKRESKLPGPKNPKGKFWPCVQVKCPDN